jgi:hypothetical protein
VAARALCTAEAKAACLVNGGAVLGIVGCGLGDAGHKGGEAINAQEAVCKAVRRVCPPVGSCSLQQTAPAYRDVRVQTAG